MDDSNRRLGSHVAGTAAIAAGFVAALILLLVVGRPDPAAPPAGESTAPTSAQMQDTLLVQVTLGRVRTASLLTATGGEPDRAVLLSLPADVLLVDGPTYTPLLDANLSLNRRLTSLAAGRTLGIRVDGGWRMERKALAGMVDAVGGVRVSVPEATTFLDETGQPVLTLPPGESFLEGPDASWYTIGVIEGENPVAGVQQRFQEIFVKATSKLPDSPESVQAMLTSLGALSDPLNGSDDVAERLLDLREDFLADQIHSMELPLRASTASDPVVTRQELEGGPAAAIGIFRVTDYRAATPPIREAFASAPDVPGVDSRPRVLVWNASGEPLASEVALQVLTDADFIAISAGAWPSVQPVTRINGIGYAPSGQSYTAGVVEALGLFAPEEFGDTGTLSPTPAAPAPSPSGSEPAAMPPPDSTPLADVDVVFGTDYKPCPPDTPNCLEELQ